MARYSAGSPSAFRRRCRVQDATPSISSMSGIWVPEYQALYSASMPSLARDLTSIFTVFPISVGPLGIEFGVLLAGLGGDVPARGLCAQRADGRLLLRG